MTPFQQMFDDVKREALAPAHVPLFESARRRRPALRAYPSIATVLAALEVKNKQDFDDKEVLARAFIAEEQACPSALWTSLLLVCCFPLLGNLRKRIAAGELPADELDQLVVATFLDTVADFSLERFTDHTFLHLRQQTQRQVFKLIAQQRQEESLLWPVEPPELSNLGDPRWPESPPEPRDEPPSPADFAEAVCLLVEHGSDLLDGEGFEIVTSSLICGRHIRSFVRRCAPGLDEEELDRLRRNAKRRHSRAVARLRKKLAGGRPRSEAAELYST